MTCVPSEDLDQPSTQSDQSPYCPHEESLGPYLPMRRTAKTDQTGWKPRLTWVFAGGDMSFCWFCHVAAHILLQQAAAMNQEVSTLKSKIRRLEEDNLKKEKEIDGLLNPHKVSWFALILCLKLRNGPSEFIVFPLSPCSPQNLTEFGPSGSQLP